MQNLNDKDIANHIKEIANDVTYLNFYKTYSYEHSLMVLSQFDRIFQGMMDADPSCTYPLSQYSKFDKFNNFHHVTKTSFTQSKKV